MLSKKVTIILSEQSETQQNQGLLMLGFIPQPNLPLITNRHLQKLNMRYPEPL
ncbi:hypothetical protein [Nostoc sp.]|uniref:hypothetical protein n=1 Tax=Nostoc sp. TaxID=1180 RepID=UPI002FF8AE61